MALIPKFHTAVAMFSVDPADVTQLNAGGSETTYGIYAGMCVGLNSSGYIKKATNAIVPLGLAGDSLAVAAGHSAYQTSLVVNPGGSKKSTQNRVSDYFNETLGSGLLTVYITGGEFYTDMFVSGAVTTPGTSAKASNANPGFIDASGSNAVGVFTSSVSNYPSGVPTGYNPSDYSMPLSSYNSTGFISFIMQL